MSRNTRDIISGALIDLDRQVSKRKSVNISYASSLDYQKLMVLYVNDMFSPEVEHTIEKLMQWTSESLADFPRFFDLTARVTTYLADNGYSQYYNFIKKFEQTRSKLINLATGDPNSNLTNREKEELCLLYAKQHPVFNPVNYLDSYYELKREGLADMIRLNR